jgi:hypothetical protein
MVDFTFHAPTRRLGILIRSIRCLATFKSKPFKDKVYELGIPSTMSSMRFPKMSVMLLDILLRYLKYLDRI